jgi:hypothetical protein
MGTKVKTVNDLDHEIEQRFTKELEKKKITATLASESVRREFLREYKNEFGVYPDFTKPFIHLFMNSWIAAQKDREWLSPEEIHIMNMRKVASEKRRKTVEANRLKQREAR